MTNSRNSWLHSKGLFRSAFKNILTQVEKQLVTKLNHYERVQINWLKMIWHKKCYEKVKANFAISTIPRKCMKVFVCRIQREETYTNHTWMSQLVPVVEVVLGVTWHSLSFDI